MKVLNFGSLNLDYVYGVDRFVLPGETLDTRSRSVKCGGKGLNQSVALARAGAAVCHAGCVGEGGGPLRALLEANGVDTSFLREVKEMQGHTVIQVTPAGENCILLYGGSNRCITEAQVRETLSRFGPGDWLVLQNEINGLPAIVRLASERGLRIVLNPSPFNSAMDDVDFSLLSWLFVNEIEMEQVSGETDPDKARAVLNSRYPDLSLLVTIGAGGSVAWQNLDGRVGHARVPACPVRAVDTTAAGDTYTGYLVAGLIAGLPLGKAMERASRAAAISVTRPGAADSIPWAGEV